MVFWIEFSKSSFLFITNLSYEPHESFLKSEQRKASFSGSSFSFSLLNIQINKKNCINIKFSGITSHGVGCGGAAAGVYESVVHHRLWIDSKLSDRRTWKEIIAIINSKAFQWRNEIKEKAFCEKARRENFCVFPNENLIKWEMFPHISFITYAYRALNDEKEESKHVQRTYPYLLWDEKRAEACLGKTRLHAWQDEKGWAMTKILKSLSSLALL